MRQDYLANVQNHDPQQFHITDSQVSSSNLMTITIHCPSKMETKFENWQSWDTTELKVFRYSCLTRFPTRILNSHNFKHPSMLKYFFHTVVPRQAAINIERFYKRWSIVRIDKAHKSEEGDNIMKKSRSSNDLT